MKTFTDMLKGPFIAIQLSVALLSLTTSIAASIYFVGAPSRLFSFTTTIFAIFLVSLYWSNLRREEYATSIYDFYIVPVCISVCLITYGNQFAYTSLWGDIGVYVNAASHFIAGGHIPFAYR